MDASYLFAPKFAQSKRVIYHNNDIGMPEYIDYFHLFCKSNDLYH